MTKEQYWAQKGKPAARDVMRLICPDCKGTGTFEKAGKNEMGTWYRHVNCQKIKTP